MKPLKLFLLSLSVAVCQLVQGQSKEKLPDLSTAYAWTDLQPLGLREPSTIDTAFIDYSLRSVPSAVTPAWATTGNLGDPGTNLIFFDRKPMTDFFFADGLWPWVPSLEKIKFYNTRIPMTLVSYNFGGDRYNGQDRLNAIFSGNVNKQLQFGAILDYLYSKGSYDNQAVKNFTWGLNGSYIADKFEVQFYHYHYNLSNRENGGITDDLYITDPAEVQGGTTSINPKSIPTNLTQAQNRTKSTDVFINAKYKLGFYRDILQEDSTVIEEYVPVTAFTWTLNWNEGKHKFTNANAQQDAEFWPERYLTADGTTDHTSYSSVKNTLGLSLLEGFNKYAKFGLAAYASIDLRSYKQTADSMLYMPVEEKPRGLDEYMGEIPVSRKNEAQFSIGAQLTKQTGSILKYEATAELGVTGRTAGDVKIDGNINTKIPIFKDSLGLMAYGSFKNEAPSYFVENFISNHFIWKNDFGKTRRVRLGGELTVPFSRTRLNIGVENIQNYIYFDYNCMPVQHDGNVQIFSAILWQNFAFKAWHWDNQLILQTSSNSDVIPMPKFVVNSNMYLRFKIARVLDVQFGVNCDYYTKYDAIGYQPETMTFHNYNVPDAEERIKLGGFPFMNAYLNMKLGKTVFYVMFSHVNQGLFGKPDYFSLPHYPLNPRRFQLGLSIQFLN